MTEKTSRELSEFQIRNVHLLSFLLRKDAFEYEIVEMIRESELEYFSLLDKIRLLESRVNIDEKTSLLKFKPDYLTMIIKTVYRVYDGSQKDFFNVSLVRFDIDDFSKINSQYGHEVGDKILVGIAEILKNTSRPTDYTIRFGGDEFDVLLPATDAAGAETYVKKLLNVFMSFHSPHIDKNFRMTLSAGIATYKYFFQNSKMVDEEKINHAYEHLQVSADDALYEAKALGKDRYCVYSENKKAKYSEFRKSYAK
jgi:diguanylate cyclase